MTSTTEQTRIPLPDGYVTYRTSTPVFSKPMPDPFGDLFFTMGLADVCVMVPADAKPADVGDTLRRLAEDIERGGPVRSLALPDLQTGTATP
jgi:hypothetical protein